MHLSSDKILNFRVIGEDYQILEVNQKWTFIFNAPLRERIFIS